MRTINGKPFRADIGMPIFLTEDNKFFSSYIKNHSVQITIIDEKSQGRSYNSISNTTYQDKEFNIYLQTFRDKYPNIEILKSKRFKMFKSYNHVYSIYRLFKEKMQNELKNYLNNFQKKQKKKEV